MDSYLNKGLNDYLGRLSGASYAAASFCFSCLLQQGSIKKKKKFMLLASWIQDVPLVLYFQQSHLRAVTSGGGSERHK